MKHLLEQQLLELQLLEQQLPEQHLLEQHLLGNIYCENIYKSIYKYSEEINAGLRLKTNLNTFIIVK